MFVDEAKIFVRGGNGGNGCMSFRREKFVPRGGPDGGSGGSGGHVVMQGDAALHTLLDLRYRTYNMAERGRHGKGKDMYGRARRRLRHTGPSRHDLPRCGKRGGAVGLPVAGRALHRSARRQRRTRQRHFRHLKEPGAAANHRRRHGRGALAASRTEIAGRRWAARFSQRRQIHPDLPPVGRHPQNRLLPVHHPDAQSRCGGPARLCVVRDGGHPRLGA